MTRLSAPPSRTSAGTLTTRKPTQPFRNRPIPLRRWRTLRASGPFETASAPARNQRPMLRTGGKRRAEHVDYSRSRPRCYGSIRPAKREGERRNSVNSENRHLHKTHESTIPVQKRGPKVEYRSARENVLRL